MITIEQRLLIRPGGKIYVPGCEPTSTITSPTLTANIQCAYSEVSVADALIAIPDATILMGFNFGNPMSRALYFVLPPSRSQGCDSCENIDWFQKLRDICKDPPEEAEGECDTFQWFDCSLDKAFKG